jgi:hypothetical protein
MRKYDLDELELGLRAAWSIVTEYLSPILVIEDRCVNQ